MSLAWDPSTDPDVAGYKIYYGVVSRTYTNMVDVGNATSVTISGLVEGTTYYFAATAYNVLGMESDYSNETPYTVPTSAVNNPPTLNPLSNLTINENAGLQTVNLSGITTGASNEVQTLTVTASSSSPGLIPNPTLNYTSPNATGSLTFTPVADANGTATISVTVNDGGASNNVVTRTFTVTVNAINNPPTLNSLSNITINEDAALQTVNLAGITSGASNEVQTLSITATSSNPSLIPNPTVNYASPSATGNLAFTPVANANGTTTISVTVNDGQAANNTFTRTFTVTVNAINDAPTFDPINNLTINEDAGLQLVSLSGITTGVGNETQTLSVTATSSNPGLIPNPTISYTSPNAASNLAFTPVANANGTATITVTVNDGQAANNTFTRTFTVTVNAMNDSPTLNALSGLALNENAAIQTVNLAGITTGATNEVQTLTVTATSSNPGLIPNPTVNYSSPNATGSLTFTPAANSVGTATITVTVNDGQAANNTFTRTFTVTVNTFNAPPTLSALASLTISEDAALQTVNLAGISSGASNEVQTLSVTATSSNPGLIPNPTVNYTSPSTTGSLTFTPVANANGTATVTVTVNDGATTNNILTRTFTVTVNAVNDAPTFDPLNNLTINEDAGLQSVSLSGITTGVGNETQTLSVTATSSNPGLIPNPTISYTSPNATGSLTFTPAANANGTATITVTVNDGQAVNNTVTRTFTVTVNAVNDSPTLNALNALVLNENAGLQTVSLAGISSGASNELHTLTITASSSNPALIPNPTPNYTSPNATGSLTFTPVANAVGTATITVTVDDGQAANNTFTRTFTVTVNTFNAPPTLSALNNLTINEDAGLQSVNLVGINSGASNEVETLSVNATSSNPGLVPNPTVNYTSPNTTGSLTFTPVANANGTATITVTVDDGQAINNTLTRTFTVTVNAVNDAPTVDPLNNLTINEDAGLQTVSLSGITSGVANETQTLTLTATSSNPGLIPNPTVSYTSPNATGSPTFTPAANANGTATVTVTVNDGQAANNTVTRTFTVAVNAVNDVPTLNALSALALNENATMQTVNLAGISSGASNELQTLTVTASSSNPGLIPNPTISYTSPNATGSLTFTPAANANGTATITVTVNDGQAANNTVTRTFTVAVNAVNNPPTLNALSNLTINEDAGLQSVNLSGITSGASNEVETLSVTATSSNPGLIPNPTVSYISPNATGSLAFTPVANANGIATITVTVNDGQAANNTVTRTFTVTVNAVNNPPTLNALNNLSINEDAGLQSVNLSGITSGASNEVQTLTVTASSSNPSLIPNPAVNYASPNATGSLTFTPVANANGTATITVTVNDGQAANNTLTRTFTVTVNEPPTITSISNQTIATNTNAGPIPFFISDRETPANNLTVWATSSAPALIPTNNISFGGSDSNRTVTLTPLPDRNGNANITITVSDGSAISSSTFQLTVLAPPPPPSMLIIITNGSGSISPVTSQQSLVVGQTYTFTATPSPGQSFAGWSGSVASSSPTITFVLTPNFVLQANFAPRFTPAQSKYAGLFYEDDEVRQSSAGSFTASITTRGTYSGQLQMGASRYSFSGQLSLLGQATNVIQRPGASPLKLELQGGAGDEADQITGRVTDGNWVATLHGHQLVFNSKTYPAPYAGQYTLIIPGQDSDPSVPAGDGYGTVRVSTTGKIKLGGLLADGTKISRSVFLCKNGYWPLYVPLYSGKGSLVSWITFTNLANSDLNGMLSWIKPADASAQYYPNGFTQESAAVGSRYTPLTGGMGHTLNLANGLVAFGGGNLAPDFSNSVMLGLNGQVINLSSNQLTLNFLSSNGTFKGNVDDPATGKTWSFSGAVLQNLNAAYGFLTGTNQSSRVMLTP